MKKLLGTAGICVLFLVFTSCGVLGHIEVGPHRGDTPEERLEREAFWEDYEKRKDILADITPILEASVSEYQVQINVSYNDSDRGVSAHVIASEADLTPQEFGAVIKLFFDQYKELAAKAEDTAFDDIVFFYNDPDEETLIMYKVDLDEKGMFIDQRPKEYYDSRLSPDEAYKRLQEDAE